MYIRGCRAAKEFRRSEEFCSGGGRVMPEIGGTHYLKMIRDTPKADGKISGGSNLREVARTVAGTMSHYGGKKVPLPEIMSLLVMSLSNF